MTAEIAMTEILPRWAVMWLLAAGVYGLGKLAARLILGRLQPAPACWEEAAWLLGWPGMDAGAFFRGHLGRQKTYPLGAGLLGLVTGVVLVWGVARHLEHALPAGWVGMAGVVMMLHFGLFRMLASYWQRQGRAVGAIMDQPALSLSLSEFWGRRWNRAFRDLAHEIIFKPALKRWGRHTALVLVFAVSGGVHELVITVPAGGGYGLPTLYFLIQAAGMGLERHLFRLGAPAPAWLRWGFTHLFTLGPAFILFPPPFVERVIIPFLQAAHALP